MDRNFWILRGDAHLQEWIHNLTGIFENPTAIVKDFVRHAAEWRRPCPLPDKVKKQCDSVKKKLILLNEYQQENIRRNPAVVSYCIFNLSKLAKRQKEQFPRSFTKTKNSN